MKHGLVIYVVLVLAVISLPFRVHAANQDTAPLPVESLAAALPEGYEVIEGSEMILYCVVGPQAKVQLWSPLTPNRIWALNDPNVISDDWKPMLPNQSWRLSELTKADGTAVEIVTQEVMSNFRVQQEESWWEKLRAIVIVLVMLLLVILGVIRQSFNEKRMTFQ